MTLGHLRVFRQQCRGTNGKVANCFGTDLEPEGRAVHRRRRLSVLAWGDARKAGAAPAQRAVAIVDRGRPRLARAAAGGGQAKRKAIGPQIPGSGFRVVFWASGSDELSDQRHVWRTL